jgi:hypothetical protein
MKSTTTMVIGLVAASILPAAYLAFFHPLSGSRDIASITGTFMVAYFFSAVATVALGVPALLALKRLNLVYWWSASGAGALVGVISLAVIRFGGTLDATTTWRFAVLGACAGLLFWVIYRIGSSSSKAAS